MKIIILLIVLGFFISFNESMIYEKSVTIKGKYILIEQFGFDDQGLINIKFSDFEFSGKTPMPNNITNITTTTTTTTPTTTPPSTTTTPSTALQFNQIYQDRSLMAMDPIDDSKEEGSSSKATPITYFNMTVWACKDREYQSLIGSSSSSFIENKLCADANAGNCPMRNITIFEGKIIQDFIIEDSDMYRVIILKCVDQREVTMKLSYELKNPTGQLSKGYLPLPKLYRYLTIFISLILFLTSVYWFKHRTVLNHVHYLLYFIVSLKFILVILTFYYWDSADKNGKFNVVLKYFQNLFFSFSETAFFAALFVLSRGWKITRVRLSVAEARTISIILLFLLSVLLFFSFYNDVYYFLSLMILYFFMMPKIFTNITKNIRLLDSHSIISRYLNNGNINDISIGLITLKKRVFRYLRTAIVLYLGAILFVSSMRIIMVWFLYWVSYSISEPISLVMLMFLLMIFKPSKIQPNIYEDSNMDTLNISELTRSLENLTNSTLDPISLSQLLEARAFDPKSCIIIQYPNENNYSLGLRELNNSNNNSSSSSAQNNLKDE